ncbi:helix-hairpin-helix domain-containing protein [Carboxylicivirga marina]|uniref:Helix-hairpin-helix domain-containing protein n=1 Tax=Carboxylicivirga marina TaxID=2800988 RepID=A0ABS1HGK3_9BACT|nr:helix-hairpin-helix domain-containing protein [Carboxylicivirga marina]MBK3516805.1 helix-hairpin-helix domain-containing protein [Carboxylicivirga marina]
MWRDLLTLSKREQLGLLGLAVLLLVLSVFLFIDSSVKDMRDVNSELSEWANSVKVIEKVEKSLRKDTVFVFDPNTESVERLQLLGFSNKAIINLIKYREAGGKISKASKLKQIYGVDSVLFYRISPYVDVSNVAIKEQLGVSGYKKEQYTYVETKQVVNRIEDELAMQIEINEADTAMFGLIRGIGPVLSRRIVAYRKKLGGFCSVEQLKEVYGLSAKVVDDNRKFLKVDTTNIRRINISIASLHYMKNHPYLDFYMAKEIYEARKEDALYSIAQFKEHEAFKKADINKLQYYFVVDSDKLDDN